MGIIKTPYCDWSSPKQSITHVGKGKNSSMAQYNISNNVEWYICRYRKINILDFFIYVYRAYICNSYPWLKYYNIQLNYINLKNIFILYLLLCEYWLRNFRWLKPHRSILFSEVKCRAIDKINEHNLQIIITRLDWLSVGEKLHKRLSTCVMLCYETTPRQGSNEKRSARVFSNFSVPARGLSGTISKPYIIFIYVGGPN